MPNSDISIVANNSDSWFNTDKKVDRDRDGVDDRAEGAGKGAGIGAGVGGAAGLLAQSAQVEYDGVSIPIPRSTYEKNGYKPDFDKLPLEVEYKAAQEKLRNAPRP